MTTHPIDTEVLRRLADNATEGPWEAHGTAIAAITGSGSCQGCSGLVSPAHEPSCYWSEIAGAGEADAEFIAAAREAVPALLDLLAAAEHRATRAEAQAEARRVNILYWQERAGATQASARTLAREFEEAQDRAHEAEARLQAVRALTDDLDRSGSRAWESSIANDVRHALDGDA